MIKKSVQILLILWCSVIINAQSGADFSILSDKAFLKLYQNPDDCIKYTQSLLISDPNIEHKMVLRNIISQAYAMKGDFVQSINMANQKDEAVDGKVTSFFLQIFGDYNLADQYQNLSLYDQSQKIISTLLENNKLLKSDDPKTRITVAKLYQLQALNFGIKHNYISALEGLSKSEQYVDNHNEENKIIGIENKIFRATFLLKQNRLEEAKSLIGNIISNLEKQPDRPFLSALTYESLARYHFLKEDYANSVKNLEKSLSKVEKLPFNSLKARIYESFSKNYLALQDDDKYKSYYQLYIDLQSKQDENAKEGIRYIVRLAETYQNKNIEFQRQKNLKRFWIWSSIISLVIIGLIIYFLLLINKNRDLKKQFAFFSKQKKREYLYATANVPKENTTFGGKTAEKDQSKISKEKEEEILQKLKEWEQSDQYLSKSMSLAMLSAQMGVNTKYLSEVINTNKGKNFNGYINELRINHIAHLLKTDPAYLNYKVSYLADYSGFSSHSAFTTVFKSVTGMSPNTYIQEIIKSRTS